jgi:hypothetical protein
MFKSAWIILLFISLDVYLLSVMCFEPNFKQPQIHRLLQEVPKVLDWSSKVTLSSVKSEGYCGASEAFATAAFY